VPVVVHAERQGLRLPAKEAAVVPAAGLNAGEKTELLRHRRCAPSPRLRGEGRG
jgi:hypothetical protein